MKNWKMVLVTLGVIALFGISGVVVIALVMAWRKWSK